MVRKLVVGPDDMGRSRLVSVDQLVDGRRKDVYRWDGTAMALPGLRGTAEVLDLGVEPGHSRWIVAEFGPSHLSIFHRTHTIDFDVVMEGAVDLVLTDEVVPLRAGDCVIVLACDHAWRTAELGCIVSCVTLGIPQT